MNRETIRRLFSVAAGVSLVGCVATLVSWGCAYWHPRFCITSEWTDQPGRVELKVREVGWNGRGFRVKSWEIEFQSNDTDTLGPLRKSITATFGAPDKKISRWDWPAHWTAPEIENARSSFYPHADFYEWYLIALRFAALPALWCLIHWAWWYGKRYADRRSACRFCG